ncbi:MAG TPA: glycosyltransferase family 39 protein [bacterium]|nr:glycosyltransferase family 39 protein [bacterium]
MKPAHEYLAGSVIIAAFIALALTSAARKSATVDEFAHLPAGLYALRTGDFSLYGKTPPVGRMIAVLPALALGPRMPDLSRVPESSWRPWIYGTAFMRVNGAAYGRVLFAARLMAVLAGAVVCLLVWLYSRRLWGGPGGLISLIACALSPTLIAHSRLVTVDVMAALFTLLFVLALLSFLKRPSALRSAIMGAALGLAVLCKFTLLFFAPFALLAPVAAYSINHSRRGPHILGYSVAAHTGTVIIAGWLALTAGYLGKDVGLHRDAVFASKDMQILAPALHLAPLPAEFLAGLDAQLFDAESGEFLQGNYLLGRWYTGSRWYYFPAAILFKQPVYALALFLFAAALTLRRRPWGEEALLLFMAGAYFLFACFFGSLQIGVRHLLPVFPLGFIIMGRLGPPAFPEGPPPGDGDEAAPVQGKRGPRRALRLVLGLALAWAMIDQVMIWPDYLAYFSPLAGGPANGYKTLLDSNLDWGQDLPGLKKWMDQNNVPRVDLMYFGHDDPARFNIAYDLPSASSPNKYLAVSADYLMGMMYPMTYNPQGREQMEALLKRVENYRTRKPAAMIGYSILVYNK